MVVLKLIFGKWKYKIIVRNLIVKIQNNNNKLYHLKENTCQTLSVN